MNVLLHFLAVENLFETQSVNWLITHKNIKWFIHHFQLYWLLKLTSVGKRVEMKFQLECSSVRIILI